MATRHTSWAKPPLSRSACAMPGRKAPASSVICPWLLSACHDEAATAVRIG
ncbi:hypothetical protein [Nonomuraea sp. NPDC003754]